MLTPYLGQLQHCRRVLPKYADGAVAINDMDAGELDRRGMDDEDDVKKQKNTKKSFDKEEKKNGDKKDGDKEEKKEPVDNIRVATIGVTKHMVRICLCEFAITYHASSEYTYVFHVHLRFVCLVFSQTTIRARKPT